MNEHMGGCVVSNHIVNGTGQLMWCIREDPVRDVDNGWRFLSDIDTEEYLSDAKNMSIWDFSKIAKIEPAILYIYEMPIGTELTLENVNGKKRFVYTGTGLPLDGRYSWQYL